MKKDKIVIIVGPTASGKSDLGVELALQFNGEVISADSRQVYRGMDIGSGKVTQEEMKGVPHYLLDIADPRDRYSVSDFKRDAGIAVRNILEKNKLPIIVGGTFFYIDAFVYDMDLPEVLPNETLRKELEEKTLEELLSILDSKDRDRGESVDRENKRRVIRALEIVDALGCVPIIKKDLIYDVLWIGIDTDDKLHDRIENRLSKRIEVGMIDEVQKLIDGGVTHERLEEFGLEYRYISRYLKGEITMEEMQRELVNKIWQYSRRQLTWLRVNKNINWFKISDVGTIKREVEIFLK